MSAAQHANAGLTCDPSSTLPAVSWIEAVPVGFRRKRAWGAVCLSSILAILLGYLQFKSGVLGSADSLWLVPIYATGAWRWHYWTSPASGSVRRYATVEVVLTRKQRADKVWVLWLVGLGGLSLLGLDQYLNQAFTESWYFGLFFVLVGLIGIFIYCVSRKEQHFTPEAIALKTEHDAAAGEEASVRLQATISRLDVPLFQRLRAGLVGLPTIIRDLDSPLFRYPVAGLLFWYAYNMLSSSIGKYHWLGALLLSATALFLAREVVAWVLGIAAIGGICYLLFAGVAALPISVAVIIGALIIAGAVSK